VVLTATYPVRILLPKIYYQKSKILELMSQVEDALDVDGNITTIATPTCDTTEDAVDGDSNMNLDPETITKYEQTVNDFTAMA
jgi:hypothetical protein